ncbi:MAG: hypothetical protein ABJZ55_01175 [Fuerstiella sp.]
MPYTQEDGRNFWFDLDNQTLFQRTQDVTDALTAAYFSNGLTFDSVYEALRQSFEGQDHPAQFINVVQVGQAGFLRMAEIQVQIMESHLDDDDAIQSAFEDFGQGVLFDDRPPRPTGRKVHMMDGTPDTWVGFHRWHAFARAAALLGAAVDRWLHINRCIALAWAIQTEANPERDNPNNPGLAAQRLSALREAWMTTSAEKLDWAFANNRFRAPATSSLAEWEERMGRYSRVQQLLRDASGALSPFHDGHGRFWELPYDQFMALPPIYDVQLIAEPGENRGARSGLVKVLKGEQPNIPQMPLNRPPMTSSDIQLIEEWIDVGCPEI